MSKQKTVKKDIVEQEEDHYVVHVISSADQFSMSKDLQQNLNDMHTKGYEPYDILPYASMFIVVYWPKQ